MPSTPHAHRPAWLEALAVAVAYAALSRGVMFVTSLGVGTGAVFWPGSGLTLGLLVIRPRERWPWILAAVAVAELTGDVWAGYDPQLSVAWAVANTVEPALGAALLLRARAGRPDLSDLMTSVRFVVYCVVVGPAVGAVIGTGSASLLVGDPWWPRVGRWLLGDGIGVLVVAPAIVTAHRDAWKARGGALWTGVVLIAAVAVGLGPWAPSAAYGLPYLVVPLLVLVAFSTGIGGAAAALVTTAAVVEVTAAADTGPFTQVGVADPLVVAELYLFIAAVATLLVSSLTATLVARTRAEERLREDALTDELTGLANRRLLDDRMGMAARRQDRVWHLAIAVIDLDGLKQVNDEYGHGAGDAVIVAAAERIRAATRPGDTVARFGGDEFVVVLEGLTSGDELQALGERIANALRVPVPWDDRYLRVGASIGIADAAEAPVDPRELLLRADEAMYIAKRAGGGLALAAV